MWTSIKFLNLKHATESIFVYSIQLSMYLFKHETCKFVYTPSYYHFYISAKSCLMSFVKPSHAFKVKSILDSSVTICLDKVVYFTFEQTPKNWAIHFTLLGKELPQQNMLIKKKILMLKFTSDSWGGKNEPWQKPTNSRWKLKNYFEPWNTAWFSRLFTYTLLTKAKINVAGYCCCCCLYRMKSNSYYRMFLN